MKRKFSLFRLSRIRIKLFAMITAVLILFLTLIAVFSTPLLFRVFSFHTYKTMNTAAEEINLCVPGSATYYFDLYSISGNYSIEFELINPDGSIAYTSANGSTVYGSDHFSTGFASSLYSTLKPVENRKYAADINNFRIMKQAISNTEYFVCDHIIDSGETLYVYSEVADVDNIVDVAGNVYSFISILMVIVMLLLFYLLVARFTKPLVEMNDITKDMAALNFERKCGNYGKDEIGELGASINTLSTTLDSTLMDLKDKNSRLEKDIEKRHQLDNARKSFINNVSHELKTPIAIISGYAEGLCEGISDDPEVIKEYCQIINDESQKMNSLVVELLELSKLESGAQPFMPEYFRLGAKVQSLINHLSLLFEQNGITVINNIPESLICYAQEDKIEIVLKNYITNAVSHCSGEKKIIASAKERDGFIEISIFNTGENIAAHDLPELWDSFYRADKAHGRSENRFGLGLSIVKSIMTAHACKYGVENVENGVVFTFEVSKDSEYYDNKH
ncbi:MAG: HAMP domain-containing protein [Clostridia bacterium]|nr:HAMP domain-containing protein [Clostridia bacterium]